MAGFTLNAGKIDHGGLGAVAAICEACCVAAEASWAVRFLTAQGLKSSCVFCGFPGIIGFCMADLASFGTDIGRLRVFDPLLAGPSDEDYDYDCENRTRKRSFHSNLAGQEHIRLAAGHVVKP